MTKKQNGRLLSLLLAGWMLLSPTLPIAQAAQEDGAVLTISTVAELRAFSQNCALDTWSQGKTMVLAADLDLAGKEFTPVPTFGGTFLGGGHTISGLRIAAAGSVQGLFRYIQPGGMVQDLTVEGIVAPGGTRSTVGGIAGENSGTLQDCVFRGTVQGKSMVGGIAGRNTADGQVVGCSASGSVSGESMTGGIAGRNWGLLMKCENGAGVNLTQDERSVDLMDVDAGAVLEDRATADDEAYYLLSGCSDTGGVVGWSSGVVQSCVNNGAVGYPHVGYNTGGVAGRQSGYLAGCVNNGTINGRKDVGGIVGQGEPFLLIDFKESTLEQLRGELDALNRLIDRAIDDVRRTGDDVSGRLEAMGSFTDSARDSSQQMLDHLSDFADDNIDSVNTLAADLTNALDKINPALDDLSDVGRQLERLSVRLGDAMDTLKDAVSIGDQAMAHIRAAVLALRQAGNGLSSAADNTKKALEQLLDKVLHGDAGGQAVALEQLKDSIAALGGAFAEVSDTIDALRKALEEGGPIPDVDTDGILEALGNASGALADVSAALEQLRAYIPSLEDIKNARESLKNAMDALRGAGDRLDAALNAIQTALDSTAPLNSKLRQALEQLAETSDSSASIGTSLRRTFDTISRAVDGLTQNGPVEFTPLGERFRQAGDDLFDALGGLSGEMDALNRTAQNSSDTLTADLQAINRQFQTVFTVLLDTVADLTDTPEVGLDVMIQDTSEEDISATRDGKVADCRNVGTVEGDRNVGGIIGAMSIEFDLDPEDDAADMFSFGTIYETKAVLQGCVNYGGVTAKKDCTGGMVGRMDLGTTLDCQNYGPITSTDGDYVGGIAGLADASVRSCWSKSALSGGNYVGGVTGWVSRLRDCYAIATITQGTECLGAIAGGVEAEGVLSGCRFVDTGVAGVDGVSFAGQAEPVSFDAISQMDGVPAEFTAFTLTLMAEGKTVAQIPFLYGSDLSRIALPPVPEQENSYGTWPEFDISGTNSDLIVEAIYNPWVTLVSSAERSGKLALALAEGQFTNEVELHVTDSTQVPPRKNTKASATWDVSLTGSMLGQEDALPLRLLSPGRDAEVWQYQNGQWVKVDAVQNGQYLLVTMEGTQGTFFIQPADRGKAILPIAGGASGLVVLLLIAGKVRRKKKTAKPRADESAESP